MLKTPIHGRSAPDLSYFDGGGTGGTTPIGVSAPLGVPLYNVGDDDPEPPTSHKREEQEFTVIVTRTTIFRIVAVSADAALRRALLVSPLPPAIPPMPADVTLSGQELAVDVLEGEGDNQCGT